MARQAELRRCCCLAGWGYAAAVALARTATVSSWIIEGLNTLLLLDCSEEKVIQEERRLLWLFEIQGGDRGKSSRYGKRGVRRRCERSVERRHSIGEGDDVRDWDLR